MITVFDMETGEILQQSSQAVVRTCAASDDVLESMNLQLGLQTVESAVETMLMPPDMAALSIAEILDNFF